MLDGLDAVVVDIQDVGVRFYTYATSMAYLMEEAAKRRIKVIVLDRPNPIGAGRRARAHARVRTSNPSSPTSRCRCSTP